MLQSLKFFLAQLTQPTAEPSPAEQAHALQLATAVLLVEVMRADPTLSDSERDAILRLVDAMQTSPKTGLIQTIPQLVGVETLYGRCQQFAAALYGPGLGHGIAWWAHIGGFLCGLLMVFPFAKRKKPARWPTCTRCFRSTPKKLIKK
jgi:membrane associated rhomboid family serine protease